MPPRYAYSLNAENYTGNFETREQATRAAFAAARDSLLEPQTVFVGKRVEADPHTAGHAKTVLREMAWQAHDEVGAPATHYLNQLTQSQIEELDQSLAQALTTWLKTHNLLPTYFKVESISQHQVPTPAQTQSQSDNTNEVTQMGTQPESPQL